MGELKYKGYTGSVEFNEEDDCLFGKVQGLKKVCITYEGMTIQDLRKDFQDSVEMYLESCKERGIKPAKPYSGHFMVRTSSDVHSRLAEVASLCGSTINEVVNRAIKREIGYAN